MNAAKRRHARTHNNAVVFFNVHFPEYEWLIDFDFQFLTDDGAFILRPDLCGIKQNQVKVAVEVSDTTISKDLDIKKEYYASADIDHYIVLDCESRKVYQFKLKGKTYIDSNELTGLDKIEFG